MCLAQGPQRSDAGETQTSGHLVSSQAHIGVYRTCTVLTFGCCGCMVAYFGINSGASADKV